jgi:hypothetical protein
MVALLLLAAAELGFRLGFRLHRAKDEARKGQIGATQGAMLGLLGFPNIILPLLLAVAITLIADLDRPPGGLLGIDQQPMLDLKPSLQPSQP